MSDKLTIDKDQLYQVYMHIKEAMSSLQILLAGLGCIHANSTNISSFVDRGRGVKKIYCPDCRTTFEEELDNGMEI